MLARRSGALRSTSTDEYVLRDRSEIETTRLLAQDINRIMLSTPGGVGKGDQYREMNDVTSAILISRPRPHRHAVLPVNMSYKWLMFARCDLCLALKMTGWGRRNGGFSTILHALSRFSLFRPCGLSLSSAPLSR